MQNEGTLYNCVHIRWDFWGDNIAKRAKKATRDWLKVSVSC